MREPEEVAREVLRMVGDGDQYVSPHAVLDLIRARDAEVRAETLAEFEREDTPPFFGHGYTEPGYWRLVGPKHYKPLPEPPTDAEVRAIRERFGAEQEDEP